MKNLRTRSMLVVALGLAAMVCALPVCAQSFSFALANPDQSGAVGTFLTYSGLITNTGAADLSLTGDSFVFAPAEPGFSADEDPAFTTFLMDTGVLTNGGVYNGPIFRVTIDPGVAPGTVAGGTASIDASYFDDTGAIVPLEQVQAFSATALVPEPSSMLIIVGGLGSLIALRRRRR